MNISEETNEFSIVLIAEPELAGKIQQLRNQLPPSSLREDPPHLTLLKGISSSASKSDGEILNDIRDIVNGLLNSNRFTASSLYNLDSRLYGPTSVLAVHASTKLINGRENLAKKLIEKGYRIEKKDISTYRPHITITLGVPFKSNILNEYKDIKAGTQVRFTNFALLRLRLSDGKRLVRIVEDRQ